MIEYRNFGKEHVFQKEKEKIFKEACKCNKCGRRIWTERGTLREGVFFGEQVWNYFSGKDGEIHSFCLCEACYDRITGQFKVPVTRTEQSEWL